MSHLPSTVLAHGSNNDKTHEFKSIKTKILQSLLVTLHQIKNRKSDGKVP